MKPLKELRDKGIGSVISVSVNVTKNWTTVVLKTVMGTWVLLFKELEEGLEITRGLW